MPLTYEEYQELPEQILKNIVLASLCYTFVLAVVTMSAFATSLNTPIAETCENYDEIYYSSNGGVITFYDQPQDGVGTTSTHICSEIEIERVPTWISFVGIGIFLVYLLHSANNIRNGFLISKYFKAKGDIKFTRFFYNLATFGAIQTIFVELCGIFLLFRATDPVDVIVNSSATLFLSEVDDLLIELFLDNHHTQSKTKRVFEFAGIEIEIDPKDIPDDKPNQQNGTNPMAPADTDNANPTTNNP